MGEAGYITVAEYAAAKGISRQAVYKRLNGSLQRFVKVVDGRKVLAVAALTDAEPEQSKPHSINGEQQLTQLIDMLQQQLGEKDKQISQLHLLLAQQQKLLEAPKPKPKESIWARIKNRVTR